MISGSVRASIAAAAAAATAAAADRGDEQNARAPSAFRLSTQQPSQNAEKRGTRARAYASAHERERTQQAKRGDLRLCLPPTRSVAQKVFLRGRLFLLARAAVCRLVGQIGAGRPPPACALLASAEARDRRAPFFVVNHVAREREREHKHRLCALECANVYRL